MNKRQIYLWAVLVLFLLGVAALFFYSLKGTVVEMAAIIEPRKETKMPLFVSQNQTATRYVSELHNISFYFDASQVSIIAGISEDMDREAGRVGSGSNLVSEVGNRILVGGSLGQSVSVFEKEPSSFFVDAVKEAFIPDQDQSQCYVELLEPTAKKNITRAIIAYPVVEDGWPYWEQGDCGFYQMTNAARYFYYDENFPDRFYFFDLGQDYIGSGIAPEVPWQDTFVIVK